MVHGSCDVMHDVKDILGHGLLTLDHGYYSFFMSCNGSWVLGQASCVMGFGHDLWVMDSPSLYITSYILSSMYFYKM